MILTRSLRILVFAGLVAGSSFGAQPYQLNQTEIAALAREASSALKVPIKTVVDKPAGSPSKDPHDYVSYARYYWPDPKKPDGLPFVSRDGDHNHAQVAKGDRNRIGNFSETVEQLAAAWHVNHDTAAATRAGEWLRAWLITPETKMNPNLNYAQVRLGHKNNQGNASGMLDSRGLANVVDALILLEDSPALHPGETKAIREWLNAFLDWFTTADIALQERRAKNNHGTWYFAQAIPLARYVGRDELVKQFLSEEKALLAHQIQPDGSQPEEIRRVDGLGYSAFNLEAHALVARQVASLGENLWTYPLPNGATLRRAAEFLQPYNAKPETWPHTQKAKLAPGFLDVQLRDAGLRPLNATTKP
jgi:hypothetical protein